MFGSLYPPTPEPHRIEQDLKAEPEWTEQDAAYLERQAAFMEFLRREGRE